MRGERCRRRKKKDTQTDRQILRHFLTEETAAVQIKEDEVSIQAGVGTHPRGKRGAVVVVVVVDCWYRLGGQLGDQPEVTTIILQERNKAEDRSDFLFEHRDDDGRDDDHAMMVTATAAPTGPVTMVVAVSTA